MNITFLIGNGFDLNLGLQTTYKQFLNNCYLVEFPDDTENIKVFKHFIATDFDNWSDAEIAFGRMTKVFKTQGKNANDYFECYDDFCTRLAGYLEAEKQKLSISENKNAVEAFSNAITTKNIIHGFTPVQQQQIKDSISSFGGGFVYNFICFNYTETLDEFVELVRSSPKILGIRAKGGSTIQNSIGQVVHVHGYTSKNMVLGVNDEHQILSTDLFSGFGSEYMDQIIKIRANGLYEEGTDSLAHRIIEQSDLIYIYGMSLGDTDKLWWERIIKRMLAHHSIRTVIHSHERFGGGALLARERHTLTNRKKNGFLAKYNKKLDDKIKENLLSRVHIDTNNIFEPLREMFKEEANL